MLSKSAARKLTHSVMIAETISLGILALPKSLAILGLIPYDTFLLVMGKANMETVESLPSSLSESSQHTPATLSDNSNADTCKSTAWPMLVIF